MTRLAGVLISDETERQPTFERPSVGRVLAIRGDGSLTVRLHRGDREYIAARCLEHVVSRPGGVESLKGAEVLVACDVNQSTEAIVMGVVSPAPARDPSADLAAQSIVVSNVEGKPLNVNLDGQRVALNASREIELRCGKASVTLTADGRIVIKGVEVVSRALRMNKIKGGVVNIN